MGHRLDAVRVGCLQLAHELQDAIQLGQRLGAFRVVQLDAGKRRDAKHLIRRQRHEIWLKTGGYLRYYNSAAVANLFATAFDIKGARGGSSPRVFSDS